ncbi:MAG: DUF4956 domain-containing protein [candidate division Zixibacteria bacterium]|nr:DUF4956 domain-containing protein [candidate division Zixibacteria bacterium]
MFDELQNINLFPTTGLDLVINLALALVCGVFIAWLYRHTYKGPGYSTSFANSIVLLAMITAVVIMTIGNNLARAFGLVGAMSIIRFRTAVKDTQDIIFIFFSLAIGMAAGVGYHKIAIIGTLFIGFVIYLFSLTTLSSPRQKEYLLQFSFSANGDELPSYMPVFKKYCRRHKVINVKSIEEQDLLELSYYVKFKDEKKNSQFVRDLNKADGVERINLFFDEEEF